MQYRGFRAVLAMVAALGVSACAGDMSEMNPFKKPNYGTDTHHGGRRAPLKNSTPYANPMDEEAMMMAPAPAAAPQPLVPPPAPGMGYGYPQQQPVGPFAGGYAPPFAPYDVPAAPNTGGVGVAPMQAPEPFAPTPMAEAPGDYYAMEMASNQVPQVAYEQPVAAYAPPMMETGPVKMAYDERSGVAVPLNPRPSKLGYKVLPDSRYAPRRTAERWQR